MPDCPHCGFSVEPGAVTCPLCGSELGTRGAGAGRPPEAAAPAPGGGAATGERLAWEEPDEDFFSSLFDAWKTSLFEPARFFRSVSWEGPFARPLLYFLIVFVAAALFGAVWQGLVFRPWARHVIEVWGGVEWPMLGRQGPASVLFDFFLSPFAGLFVLGVSTLIFHLFVLLVVPTRRGIGQTARVVCYSWGPAVLAIVPVLGPLAAYLVWIPVLQVLGLREAHRTTTGRAILVWLGPLVILLLMSIALAILVTLFASAYSGHGNILRRI
jgi:hypothetical protein